MTTEQERKNWVAIKLLELEQNYYGLLPLKDNLNKAPNYRAIQELRVRMNVFAARGTKDNGTIKYPEANRIIHYNLDPTNLSKCRIMLKALDKKVKYMYVDKSQIINQN